MLEKLKELIEKIKDIIENGKKPSEKLLESLKYYTFILGEEEIMRYSKESFPEMGEVLGEIETGVATFGDFTFPIGSFEQQGNTITVKEQVKIYYDEKNKIAKMYMNGQPICSNPEVEKEMARQIEQNGIVSTVKVNGYGEVVKNDSEKYREGLYNQEARKKTEEVGRTFEQRQKENPQKEKQNEREEEWQLA